jgi:hypothetical protein
MLSELPEEVRATGREVNDTRQAASDATPHHKSGGRRWCRQMTDFLSLPRYDLVSPETFA